MLGPTTHDALLDKLTRNLAVDLFVNPAGMRMLAVLGVAKAARQPKSALPLECLQALFSTVIARKSDVQLEFNGIDATTGQAVIRLFRDDVHLAPAFLISQLCEAKRWRSLKALAGIILLQGETGGGVFDRSDDRGLSVRWQAWKFRGDPILAHYWSPQYFIILALEHIILDCLPRSPVYGRDGEPRRALLMDLARFFGNNAGYDREAQMLHHLAHDADRLKQAIKEYADEMRQAARSSFPILMTEWWAMEDAVSSVEL